MRAIFLMSIIIWGSRAWPNVRQVRNPFEMVSSSEANKPITDCMHVTSEEGNFTFRKHLTSLGENPNPMEVCGLYVVGEPDSIVEITVKHLDLNCEDGGLMGFIDGWELNGEYFPGIKDHHKTIEQRTTEFCNDYNHWPLISHKRVFRSSQNAALLQYRIPMRGSFVASVKFYKNNEPCNIMVQQTESLYILNNYGKARNCTMSAIFPAVIQVVYLKIGERHERTSTNSEKVDYDCQDSTDRLEIGGSSGLESYNMEKSSNICGTTQTSGPEQAIFCGVTSAKLVSSGKYRNVAGIMFRQADEHDLNLATLVCPL